MNRSRPPLRALEAFEVAARFGSFRAAAEELRLTPSAVSHHVRSLEAHLAVRLFERAGRGVTLSSAGRRYFETLSECFGRLDEATSSLSEQARRSRSREVLVVHTPPSIASRWLLPRLPEFIGRYPEVDVRVVAETGRTGFDPHDVDLAILYGHRRRAGNIPLLREAVQPLCCPSLVERAPVAAPADLLQRPLIFTRDNLVSWTDWFRAQGVRRSAAIRGAIQLDPSHVALDAAVNGLGFVLESDVLAADDLATGRLVAPLRGHAIRISSYALAISRRAAGKDSAEAFRAWLVGLSGPHLSIRGPQPGHRAAHA